MGRHESAVFALSEIEVLSNGKNLAREAKVTASDSEEVLGWSKDKLIDGITKTVFLRPLIQPSSYLRKSFEIPGEITRATVYATARGVYELRLNGQRVGDHLLAPEWTSYHHRIQYQTFDVTAQLHQGQNAVGAILGAGWYSGRIGLVPRRRIYGSYPQLLLRLDVKMKDGKFLSLVSDESWQKALKVPLVSSDILDGEIYDARKEMKGWDSPDFQGKGWQNVEADADLGQPNWFGNQMNPFVFSKKWFRSVSPNPKPGSYIFDLGQNMVGWCRFQLHGRAGDTVTARYAETLNDDGAIYTANLRGAPATDRFILRGGGEEVLEPHFTYHGFRYVEVTGDFL